MSNPLDDAGVHDTVAVHHGKSVPSRKVTAVAQQWHEPSHPPFISSIHHLFTLKCHLYSNLSSTQLGIRPSFASTGLQSMKASSAISVSVVIFAVQVRFTKARGHLLSWEAGMRLSWRFRER